MKIALIGTGKTGSQLLNIVDPSAVVGPFNSKRPLNSKADLAGADVAIVFVTPTVAREVAEILIQTQIPTVWGTTGVVWDTNFLKTLHAQGLRWVEAKNFGLLFNLLHSFLETLGEAKDLLPELQYQMREVHHTKKLDAPSGTALAMKKWLGQDVEIESVRQGDVIGLHQLTVRSSKEKITLTHESLDRSLFAEGALLAAKLLLKNMHQLNPGMTSFHHLLEMSRHNSLHLGEQL